MPTPEIPVPTVSIWDQYVVTGIMFVVIVAIGYALYHLFRAYSAWQTTENDKQRVWQEAQYEKRETERKTQLAWYEVMGRKHEEEQAQRDRQWQKFLLEISDQQARQYRENNEVLEKLIRRIDALTETMTSHDRASKERAEELGDIAKDIAAKVVPKRRNA
ncbi:MAG TPA: hypothetical protein VIH16_03690 [Bellilinea sp.]